MVPQYQPTSPTIYDKGKDYDVTFPFLPLYSALGSSIALSPSSAILTNGTNNGQGRWEVGMTASDEQAETIGRKHNASDTQHTLTEEEHFRTLYLLIMAFVLLSCRLWSFLFFRLFGVLDCLCVFTNCQCYVTGKPFLSLPVLYYQSIYITTRC
jgi:hypothetical protein